VKLLQYPNEAVLGLEGSVDSCCKHSGRLVGDFIPLGKNNVCGEKT
jgi:hypothetical protein